MASFYKYIPLLQQVEGGYQADPDDDGNYNSLGELAGTNYGISARFYERILGYPPKKADMLAITEADAKHIFKQYFWRANNAAKINNQAVANTVIDHQVNAGRGIKLAQTTLNRYFGQNLDVDGVMGPNTLAALNSVDARQFVKIYNEQREDYYRSLGGKYVNGWLIRLAKFAYQHTGNVTGLLLASTALIGGISYFLIKN